MRVIGVTGGVGSGKSAVLNYIEAHFDARVIKADDVGHLLMMPGQVCYEPVIQLFGEWIVKEDGSLDRETISKIVFEKKEILEKLNAIIHPAVKKYILREIERSKKEETEFFFIEAALLIEEKYDEICDELWYIYVNRAKRLKRLVAGRGGTVEKYEKVIENQATEDFYKKNCDVVIDNEESVENTANIVKRLLFSPR